MSSAGSDVTSTGTPVSKIDSHEEVDLTDPQTFTNCDMQEFWRETRVRRPVYWHAERRGNRGFWVVARHADVMSVYRDNIRFTSERGNVLVTLLAGGDSAAGQMLAVTDGPRHRELRNILLRAFSPRALQRVSEQVRRNTRRLVWDAVRNQTCDFATEVASRIPLNTICNLLDVPDSDRDFLLRMTKQALSSEEQELDDLDSAMARNEILLYFGDLVAERRVSPGDDVISVLARSRIGDEPLTDADIVLNCYSLIVGGDETSRLAMIESLSALMAHPDQWDLLRQRVVSLDTATEEVLRWATPTMHFGRTAVTDTMVGDTSVRAGDIVTLWHSSANRDESVFAQPYTFNLGRTPNKHITFGYGPHFCLGSHLGRVEVREMLDALRSFAAAVEPTGPEKRIYSNFLTGISSLPVRFTPDVAGIAGYDNL